MRARTSCRSSSTSATFASAISSFVSDNHAPAHPRILEALAAANSGYATAYGDDPWTERAEDVFREHFGPQARAFPVFNGTGANVSALAALAKRHDGVICTDVAHLHVDECGAPEQLAGVKLLTVATGHGKLAVDDLTRWEHWRGDEHRVQPRIVSLTQATELGTVYTVEETRAIADAAHALGMHVHVDGARLANAAASLGQPLCALTTAAGVDVVSFGGTKNGLVFGDAVVFCTPALAEEFAFNAQASRPARVEDALHLGAAHRALRGRPLARERAPRERHGATPRVAPRARDRASGRVERRLRPCRGAGGLRLGARHLPVHVLLGHAGGGCRRVCESHSASGPASMSSAGATTLSVNTSSPRSRAEPTAATAASASSMRNVSRRRGTEPTLRPPSIR